MAGYERNVQWFSKEVFFLIFLDNSQHYQGHGSICGLSTSHGVDEAIFTVLNDCLSVYFNECEALVPSSFQKSKGEL